MRSEMKEEDEATCASTTCTASVFSSSPSLVASRSVYDETVASFRNISRTQSRSEKDNRMSKRKRSKDDDSVEEEKSSSRRFCEECKCQYKRDGDDDYGHINASERKDTIVLVDVGIPLSDECFEKKGTVVGDLKETPTRNMKYDRDEPLVAAEVSIIGTDPNSSSSETLYEEPLVAASASIEDIDEIFQDLDVSSHQRRPGPLSGSSSPFGVCEYAGNTLVDLLPTSSRRRRRPTLLVIMGKGTSRAGILSTREVLVSGLDKGSALYHVRRATSRGWVVVLLDPNALGGKLKGMYHQK